MNIYLNVFVILEQHYASLQRQIHIFRVEWSKEKIYKSQRDESRFKHGQEFGLSGLGVWGEGHLTIVFFHLSTKREINTKSFLS